jgi:hypothetical protein
MKHRRQDDHYGSHVERCEQGSNSAAADVATKSGTVTLRGTAASAAPGDGPPRLNTRGVVAVTTSWVVNEAGAAESCRYAAVSELDYDEGESTFLYYSAMWTVRTSR